jgi:hypothetical protein
MTPATTACCSCLGAVHARGGTEGWSDARQRTRKAEGDGGRQAQRALAESGGGAANLDIGTKLGCSFLEAAASGIETDCSHERLNVGVYPNIGALAVLVFFIYFYILLGSNPCMSIAV